MEPSRRNATSADALRHPGLARRAARAQKNAMPAAPSSIVKMRAPRSPNAFQIDVKTEYTMGITGAWV